MQITDETIEKTMKMAAIALRPAEKKHLYHDLRQMVEWVEQLQSVDTRDVSPLTTLSPEVNQMASDTPERSLTVQEALKNAPEHDGAYFHVPKRENQQP